MRTSSRRFRMMGALVGASLALGMGVLAVQAQPADDASERPQAERLQGFSTVVINHVNEVMGTEQLPVGNGGALEPGVLVTVAMDRVQVFDRGVIPLQAGLLGDSTVAGECVSGCPAVFYDALQRTWLEAAVESTAFAVEVPQRVLLAVHRDIPAGTLLQVAYAAAETRPVQPPRFALLTNNTRGSMRALPFFLVPPRGLQLRQGSAALGLTVEVSPGRYRVSATDPRYAREHEATSPGQLQKITRDIKKRYPGKEAVILVPRDGVTVGEVMAVAALMGRGGFPRLVLSAGQDVRTP